MMENLITALDPAEFEQTICYICGASNPCNVLEEQGYRVICLGMPKRTLRRLRPMVSRRLARIIDEHEIDIVHCQRHKPTVYGVLATLLSRRAPAVFTTIHGEGYAHRLNRKAQNLLLLNRASRIIAVSNAVRDDIRRSNWIRSPESVVTVYNGIDPDTFRSQLTVAAARDRLGLPDGNTMIFGTVGRLTRIKGHVELISAFARVRAALPNATLAIVGSGAMDSELRRIAAECGVLDHVQFTGYRSDIPDVIRAFDVFVFPSLTEGLGLALLETMAAGIPVIASDIGGIPEVLTPESGGVLVRPGEIDSLANAMIAACRMNADQRRDIGHRLMRRVDATFTVKHMAAEMRNHYRAVAEERSNR